MSGYAEAELVCVAPPSAGLLQTLAVRRGDRVGAGQLLYALAAEGLTALVSTHYMDEAERRDRLTFAMMVGVPIMQIVLFGYAVKSDPRNLPTVVVLDNGPLVRSIVGAVENTGYFRVVVGVRGSHGHGRHAALPAVDRLSV